MRHIIGFFKNFFRKGDMILLEGRLQVRSYQDKDTGKNRNAYEVVADSANFCGSKGENRIVEAAPTGAYAAPAVPDGFDIVDDSTDLPF